MAWTQDDLDRVEQALATGTRDVQIQGRRITYRSMRDLLTIRRVIQQSLGQQFVNRVYLDSPS